MRAGKGASWKCVGCYACAGVCPTGALSFVDVNDAMACKQQLLADAPLRLGSSGNRA